MGLLGPPLPPSGPIYSIATTPLPPRHGYPGLPVTVSPLPSQPGTLPQCYSLFALCRPNFGMPQLMAAPFRLNCHLHPDPELPSVCVVLTLNGFHLLLWGSASTLGLSWGCPGVPPVHRPSLYEPPHRMGFWIQNRQVPHSFIHQFIQSFLL